jgi:hypothetical protein
VALYFTSEEAAREGARKERPENLRTRMKEMTALSVGEPQFFDLERTVAALPA